MYPYRDLEFLNMFPENMEALYELQSAVQEFIDSYVYIKGYNKNTVERIQHMYMKTYRVRHTLGCTRSNIVLDYPPKEQATSRFMPYSI